MTDAYEKLGVFYLGKSYDLDKASLRDDLLLFDSKDLTTHGVVFGMTGSGKTGLSICLLEEALIDGIPELLDALEARNEFRRERHHHDRRFYDEEDERVRPEAVPGLAT